MLNLKQMRLGKGWTQHELARRAEMYDSDLSKIERGWMRPYPSQAQRLATVLEVEASTLLIEVDDTKGAEHAGDITQHTI